MKGQYFVRTPSGQRSTYHFHEKPIIWVEGASDIPFFLDAMAPDTYFKIMNAGGKPQCLYLVREMVSGELPYVVVLDGDYDVLTMKKSIHRRAIFLQRYSFENYLFEVSCVVDFCRHCLQEEYLELDVRKLFIDYHREIESEFRELLAIDVALRFLDESQGVLRDIAQFLDDSKGPMFLKSGAIQFEVKEARAVVDEDSFRDAKELLRVYLRSSPLIHLIRGHDALVLLRHFICKMAKRLNKRKPHVDNVVLASTLSSRIWKSRPLPKDHLVLRRKLRNALREVNKMLAAV